MSFNNIVPAWMYDEENRYWIEYTDGTIKNFYRPTKESARHYFMMEGDHAYNWGRVSNDPRKKVLFKDEVSNVN